METFMWGLINWGVNPDLTFNHVQKQFVNDCDVGCSPIWVNAPKSHCMPTRRYSGSWIRFRTLPIAELRLQMMGISKKWGIVCKESTSLGVIHNAIFNNHTISPGLLFFCLSQRLLPSDLLKTVGENQLSQLSSYMGCPSWLPRYRPMIFQFIDHHGRPVLRLFSWLSALEATNVRPMVANGGQCS